MGRSWLLVARVPKATTLRLPNCTTRLPEHGPLPAAWRRLALITRRLCRQMARCLLQEGRQHLYRNCRIVQPFDGPVDCYWQHDCATRSCGGRTAEKRPGADGGRQQYCRDVKCYGGTLQPGHGEMDRNN